MGCIKHSRPGASGLTAVGLATMPISAMSMSRKVNIGSPHPTESGCGVGGCDLRSSAEISRRQAHGP